MTGPASPMPVPVPLPPREPAAECRLESEDPADRRFHAHRVPARWACPGCGRPFVRGEALRCSACRRPARLAAGDEIVLDRIEMEVP